MRLFVALDVDDGVVEDLRRAVGPVARRHEQGLRWTRPESWHVTLAFLGEVERDPAEVEAAVRRGVADAGTGAIRLSLGSPGHFNRAVLWVGVDDEPPGTVGTVGGAVRGSLAADGFRRDEKPLHPHLTLARCRGRGRFPRQVLDDLPHVTGTWTVSEAKVYRSQLGDGPARYQALAAIPL